MTVSASAGPLVAFGGQRGQENNPQGGPSLFQGGGGLLDPRPFYTYNPGQDTSKKIYGFQSNTHIPVLDVTATGASTALLAALQVPVAGTAMTLASSTSAPMTVGVTITRADTGATVTGLLSLHGSASAVAMGPASSPVNIWDPTTLAARNVTITGSGNESSATFTVRGYDVYGYPMSETITGPNNGTATGAKAFKYIASVTPAGTVSGTNVSVGIGTLFGFPLRVDYIGQVVAYQNGTLIVTPTVVAAVTTSPATATTGDVRGTYASTGATRIVLYVTPPPGNLSSITGLFGVTQA